MDRGVKYLGKANERYTGPKGLDGLWCHITKRVIGTPLRRSECQAIEYMTRTSNKSGFLGVQKSNTSASYRAVFKTLEGLTVDLGHRKNPAEAALLYHMSQDPRKPFQRVLSNRPMHVPMSTTSLYYFDLDENDLDVINYLKTDSNLNGYENVTKAIDSGRYRASMCVDNRDVYLGSYSTIEEAAFAVHIYFTTGNSKLQNEVPRRNEGQNMFVLSEAEIKEIEYLRSPEAVNGYKGVVFTKNKYQAYWAAYKRRLSLGRYFSAEEAAWAVHLYLDLGLEYKDIAVLAKTDLLRPIDLTTKGPGIIEMYEQETNEYVKLICTREQLEQKAAKDYSNITVDSIHNL